MKLKALLFAFLLMASATCKSSELYATLGDAFSDNLGGLGPFKNLGSIEDGQVSSTEIIFECTRESFVDRQISEGIHPALAIELKKKVQTPSSPEDFQIRFIKPVPYRVNDHTMQMAACGYRLAGNGKLHFVCLASQGLVDQDSRAEDSVVQGMQAGLVSQFINNKHKYSRFHSFNSLGFSALHTLGNVPQQQQEQLDKFFDGASAQKTKQWEDIYKHKNDPFMVQLFRNGITHFTSHSDVSLLEGVMEKSLKEYTQHLMKKLEVPVSAQAKFKDEIELATLGDKGEWKELEFMFKKSKGEGKYTMILTVQNPSTQEYDFLIIDIKASFAIGDDVFIYTKTKKILFGLWSSQEVVVERRPANLSEEAIKYMFNFFKYSAIDSFMRYRKGVNKARSRRRY